MHARQRCMVESQLWMQITSSGLSLVVLITVAYQVYELKFNEIPVSVPSLNIYLFCYVYYNDLN